MFKGYAQSEQYGEILPLFRQMMQFGVKPSCYTFPLLLKSCGKASALRLGQQIHCGVIKNGAKSDMFVGTTLMEMYSDCREAQQAYKVFSEMALKNVVAWTSIINGFIFSGDVDSARTLFEAAPERDMIMWNVMISCYIQSGDMVTAQQLFSQTPNKDLMMWNTMLRGYINNKDIKSCKNLFQQMPARNTFSWNTYIHGIVRFDTLSEAFVAFKRMLADNSDVKANDTTLVTLLSACAGFGSLELGRLMHAYVTKFGYGDNTKVQNSLMGMYAKCGSLDSSLLVFGSLMGKDLVSWNTMICGLAMHGRGFDALGVFGEMKSAGMRPDGVTFIGVLCACGHLGLVETGVAVLYSMAGYAVEPRIEHYGCVVDLCARAGSLDQAYRILEDMPMKADEAIRTSLLGAELRMRHNEVSS